MTNQLGTGTINRAVNFIDEEEALVSRFAAARGQSFSDITRRALRVYMALAGDKGKAVEMAKVRRERKPLTARQRATRSAALLAIFLGWLCIPNADHTVRRSRSSVRPIRVAVREVLA